MRRSVLLRKPQSIPHVVQETREAVKKKIDLNYIMWINEKISYSYIIILLYDDGAKVDAA